MRTDDAPGSGAVQTAHARKRRSRTIFAALRPRGSFWHWSTLVLLTILGGALRFFWIERPPLWGDEGATYWRITATYGDLLHILQNNDGFMPLHYSLYWLIAQYWRMEPFVMRAPVAVAGTLMTPAMYFLARQVADRRTALLAAAFAACSAWLMGFSRDAKMYMPLWLFVTLNMGCLMWWLNSKSRIAFWGWVTAGVAMVGIHSPSLVLLPLAPLLLLTQRRHHWKHAVMLLIGLGIIGIGPAVYYTQFSRFIERTGGPVPGAIPSEEGPEGRWGASGIGWVDTRNRGRSGPDLVIDSATSYLFSWEWPWADRRRYEDVVPYTMTAATIALAVVLVIFAMGMFPWPMKWRGGARGRGGQTPEAGRSAQQARSDELPAAAMPLEQGWWQRGLWVSAWLILPTYGFFYCRSVAGFYSPVDWLIEVNQAIEGRWQLAICGAVAAGIVLQLWRPRPWLGAVLFPAVAVVMAHVAMSVVLQPEVWEWTEPLMHPWVLTGVLIAGPALAWYYAGASLRERTVKLGQFTLFFGLMFAIVMGLYMVWSHMAMQAQAAGTEWRSMWMPRYLGVIWPAVGLSAAMLITRLPTLPVRAIAIVVLLGANLTNGLARVIADTEPPLDRVTAELRRGIEEDSMLTLAMVPRGVGPGPAQGWLFTTQGRYYLAMAFEIDPLPTDFRTNRFLQQLNEQFNLQRFLRTEINPQFVRSRLRGNDPVRTLVIWERHPFGHEPADDDPILDTLRGLRQGDWELADDQIIRVRQFWSWRDLGYARRREYVRHDPASPEPAVAEIASP